MSWEYHMPTKVVFGAGALDELPEHVTGRVLLVTGKHAMKEAGVTDRVTSMLGDVTVFDRVEENPSHQTVDLGVQALSENSCDQVVALGGGSPMDAAKLMALIAVNGGKCADYVWGEKEPTRKGLPFIAVTTTSGTASEVTPFSVISDYERHLKGGVGNPLMYPDLALVDPELTLTMPKGVTANTGADALSHAVESYWAKSTNPVSDLYALEAIKMVFANLERACNQPQDLEGRTNMALASLLAGLAFSNTGTTAAHSVSHALTAFYGIPHGNGCLINIPWLMGYYMGGDEKKVMATVKAMGADSMLEGKKKVWELMDMTGLVTRLGSIGLKEADIPRVVEAASHSSVMQSGPRPISGKVLARALREMI